MKFRPILFSTPMVKAILNGTKTQTRRLIKSPERLTKYEGELVNNKHFPFWKEHMIGKHLFHTKNGEFLTRSKAEKNDVFWVRETWAEVGNFATSFYANSEVVAYKTQEAFFTQDNFLPEENTKLDTTHWNWDMIKWKPSIFMPKEYCRTFLKVTSVRVERLNDISDKDAIEEGIQKITALGDLAEGGRILGFHDYTVNPKDGFNTFFDPKESFFSLWESINGKKSLESNPWVFVYDFEIIEKPENFI